MENEMTVEEYCTPDKTYICSFSGGKDSVATYLYLTRELRLPKVFGLFADTGWEDEMTYRYVDDLIKNHGFKICKVQGSTAQLSKKGKYGDDPLTMVKLSQIKGRFPSTMARFCTTELKLRPILAAYEFMLKGSTDLPFFNNGTELPDLTGEEVVMVTGVRGEESPKRAKMSPFIFDDFFNIYKWMPIHAWKVPEVFGIHHKYGIKVNPLYLKGAARVGCYPCIMCTKDELNSMARQHPEVFDKVRKVEIELNQLKEENGKEGTSTFWANDKTSTKHRSMKTEAADGSIHYVPTALDVRDWALGVDPIHEDQGLLFEDFDDTFNIEAPVCESQYGLCEVAMKEKINFEKQEKQLPR
jgi:3'-phosphoadenosine 5'-phosphosulfate sulfotransferase (PAPS reductase)/FAD synthetase